MDEYLGGSGRRRPEVEAAQEFPSASSVQKESVGDLDCFLQQACHSSLRASVNHTHILEMGKGGELMRLRKMQVCVSVAMVDVHAVFITLCETHSHTWQKRVVFSAL